ncbi:MAG: effector binding domain-containing protein [Sphaerochaeta sp.]
MDGYDNLCKTLDYFEQRLASQSPITSVAELAQHSGYCSHHLSNLFTAHTDLKLKEYVQARLLSALFLTAFTTGRSLGTLAMDYGFHDYETFYRACKRTFRKSPSIVLEQGVNAIPLQQRIYPQRTASIQQVSSQVVSLGAFSLCGLSFFIWPEIRSFHRQWQQFSQERHSIAGQKHPETTYQFTAWKDGDEQTMRILCGVEVDPKVSQQAILSREHIPSSTCIRFLHTEDVNQIRNTYQYIYGTFFSESKYKSLGNWELQRYETDSAPIEIYIPIRM